MHGIQKWSEVGEEDVPGMSKHSRRSCADRQGLRTGWVQPKQTGEAEGGGEMGGRVNRGRISGWGVAAAEPWLKQDERPRATLGKGDFATTAALLLPDTPGWEGCSVGWQELIRRDPGWGRASLGTAVVIESPEHVVPAAGEQSPEAAELLQPPRVENLVCPSGSAPDDGERGLGSRGGTDVHFAPAREWAEGHSEPGSPCWSLCTLTPQALLCSITNSPCDPGSCTLPRTDTHPLLNRVALHFFACFQEKMHSCRQTCIPGVLQCWISINQAQDAQCDRHISLLHDELMAQRAEESIQRKLGGRVRSGEGSGHSPWRGKGENGKHQKTGCKEDPRRGNLGKDAGFVILYGLLFRWVSLIEIY